MRAGEPPSSPFRLKTFQPSSLGRGGARASPLPKDYFTMKMDMTKPCSTCPFRTDATPFIRPDRAEEILDSLIVKDESFRATKPLCMMMMGRESLTLLTRVIVQGLSSFWRRSISPINGCGRRSDSEYITGTSSTRAHRFTTTRKLCWKHITPVRGGKAYDHH